MVVRCEPPYIFIIHTRCAASWCYRYYSYVLAGSEWKENQEDNMSVISMKQLLEAGVHFGHQKEDGTLRWLHISSQRETESIS